MRTIHVFGMELRVVDLKIAFYGALVLALNIIFMAIFWGFF